MMPRWNYCGPQTGANLQNNVFDLDSPSTSANPCRLCATRSGYDAFLKRFTSISV
jgi:hypothetical protein